MSYGSFETIAGIGNLFDVTPAPTNLRDLPFPPGTVARAQSPIWGPGEFIFARAGAGIRLYGLCVLTPVWDGTNFTMTQNMTECPNTTLLGRPVYVYQGDTALTTGQYGWFMKRGVSPVNGNATIAADTAAGIVAAGQIGALAAGKQVLGARSVVAATQTVARTGVGNSGDNTIFFPGGTAGFFVGGYVSGTGVGTNAIISKVFADRIQVTVVNSAAIAGTVTQTANNATIFYNYVAMSDPIAQGPIT
jgi:hypothetical protein